MIKLFSFLAGKKRAAASSPPRSDRPTVAPSASSAQVKASSMPSQYDPQLAILLAGLCEQTYIQYGNGPPPPTTARSRFPRATPRSPPSPLRDSRHRAVDAVFALASVEQRRLGTVTPRVRSFARFAAFRDVYFGFALTSANYNIIALRGTRTQFEWAIDASLPQVPVPLVWYHHQKFELARSPRLSCAVCAAGGPDPRGRQGLRPPCRAS